MTFLNFFAAWARNKWWKLKGWEPLTPVHWLHTRNARCEICVLNQDGVCSACGCLVMAKTLLASEKCPKGFWSRIRIKKSDKGQ